MNETARDWLVAELGAGPAQIDRLAAYVAMLLAENARQNLIARSTEADIWWRHIVDAAQLATLAPARLRAADRHWVDLGSGAGLPGIVLAILLDSRISLVEMRPARVAFLERCVAELGLANATCHSAKVESLDLSGDVLCARAFAPLPRLIARARHMARAETLWLLPKGRNAVNELAELPRKWQDAFHVKQSATSDESAILIGRGRFDGRPA